MTLHHTDAPSITDHESSTAYTPSATSESIITDSERANTPQPPSNSSIPWPGSTYIIRSLSTGKAISFQQGQIVLSQLGGPDAVRWQCVENGGWLGFKDPASAMFLGYDKNEELCCCARTQMEWENFCVRQRPEGGCVMLMSHYNNYFEFLFRKLRPVGIKSSNGLQKLATTPNWQDESTAWEFIKV